MNINEFLAKECGYPLDDDGYSEGFTDEDGQYIKWNYKDARCMTIIEPALHLCTEYMADGTAQCRVAGKHGFYNGRTGHLARVACIEAIYNNK